MTVAHLGQLVRRADIPALDAFVSTARASDSLAQAAALLVAHHSDGHTCLHWAAMSHHPAVLPLLLPIVPSTSIDVQSTASAQFAQTPLHWACVAGHAHAVRSLLHAGADSRHPDAKGYNAAIHAAQYGHIDILHILLSTQPSLRTSVDITGNSLVQWAAYYNHYPAVRYLTLIHTLHPDAPDHSGTTTLHRASRNDHYAVVEVLLRAGASITTEDAQGKTALELAPPRSRSATLLRQWQSLALTPERPVPDRHTPTRYGLVLFYYALLVASYYVYYTDIISAKPALISRFLIVVSHVCLVFSLISHFRATFRDPGVIPRGTAQQFVDYIDRSIEHGDSTIQLLPSAYCFTCLAPRPLRSKHSRNLDACVRRFDHECPWVNNSVGLHTHQPLLSLVFFTAILQIIFMYAVVRMLVVRAHQSRLTFLTTISQHPFVVFLILLNLIVVLFCITLLVSHLRLVARGLTTYEALVAERLNKPAKSDYDKGACHNILTFMSSSGPGTGKPYSPITMSSISTFLASVFSSRKHASSMSSGSDTLRPLKTDSTLSTHRSEPV